MDWAMIEKDMIAMGFHRDEVEPASWVTDEVAITVVFTRMNQTEYMEVRRGGRLFLRYALLRNRVMDEGIIRSTIQNVKRIELEQQKRIAFQDDQRAAMPL